MPQKNTYKKQNEKTHTLLPPSKVKPLPFPSSAVMYTQMAAIPLVKTFQKQKQKTTFP